MEWSVPTLVKGHFKTLKNCCAALKVHLPFLQHLELHPSRPGSVDCFSLLRALVEERESAKIEDLGSILCFFLVKEGKAITKPFSAVSVIVSCTLLVANKMVYTKRDSHHGGIA